MPGPPRVPTALLRARGSIRARHRHDDLTFAAEPPPEPPAEFAPAEAAVWNRLVPMLASYRGVLARVDAAALARYCRLTARFNECSAFIAQRGMTYPIKNEKGEVTGVVEFPAVARESQLADKLLALEQQFGLTPAARARLNIDLIDVVKGAKEAGGFVPPWEGGSIHPPASAISPMAVEPPTMPQDRS